MSYLDVVPHGTIDKYLDLLLDWNKKVNLVSVKDKEELMERHILDSLQLMDYINVDDVVYDIGSGAGFPGLILSFAGIKKVNLVEKNIKKVSFLTVASVLSGNIVNIHNDLIENLVVDKCDVITARGLASLDEIFAATAHIKNARYVLLKGKNIENEIKKALFKWNFQYILYQSKTSLDGCVLEVKQLERNEQQDYSGSESEGWSR